MTGSLNMYFVAVYLTGSAGIVTSASSANASAFFGDGSHLAGIPSTASFSGVYVPNAGGTMTGSLNMNNEAVYLTGAAGNLTSASSVTASAFFGDGSHLAGIPSTASVAALYVPDAGGTMTGSLNMNNVAVNLTGAAGNVASASSVTASAFFGDASHLTTVSILAGAGFGVTVSTQETHTSSVTVVNSILALTGSAGNIVGASSITASAFFGDGSHLAGIPSTASMSGLYVPNAGGTMTGSLNMNNVAVNLTGSAGNVVSAASVTASAFFGDGSHLAGVPSTASIAGLYVPDAGGTMTGSLNMNNVAVNLTGAAGNVTSASSVTASAFFGNGSRLAGIPSTASIAGLYVPDAGGTMTGSLNMNNVAVNLTGSAGNVTSASSVTASGFFGTSLNVGAGNLTVNSAGYLNTANEVYASGGFQAGAGSYITQSGSILQLGGYSANTMNVGFYTNGVAVGNPAMYINTSNAVGINTITPITTLQVVGGVVVSTEVVTSTLTVQGNSFSVGGTTFAISAAGVSAYGSTFTILSNGNVGIGVNNPVGQLVVVTPGVNTQYSSFISSNGYDSYSITPTANGVLLGEGAWVQNGDWAGNVNSGILSLSGANGALWYDASGTPGTWNVANGGQLWNSTGAWTGQMAGTVTGLVQSVASGYNYFTGGNLGINTTNPQYDVEITSGILYIDGNAGGSPNTGLDVWGSTFVVNDNGHVGIGTQSPQAALHIVGAKNTVAPPASATPSLIIGNAAGSTQNDVLFEMGGSLSGAIRTDASNMVIDPVGTGATYLNWDSGTGGLVVGNGAATALATMYPNGSWLLPGTLALSSATSISLNNLTSNAITWAPFGVALPQFNSPSLGEKLQLYPQETATTVDYALGINGSTLWYSVPGNAAIYQHEWFGGQTELMSLNGAGSLVVASSVTVGGFTGAKNAGASDLTATGNTWFGTGGSYHVTSAGAATFADVTPGNFSPNTASGSNYYFHWTNWTTGSGSKIYWTDGSTAGTNLMSLASNTGNLITKGTMVPSGTPDFAEYVQTDSDVESYEVVTLSAEKGLLSGYWGERVKVSRANKPYQQGLIGVIVAEGSGVVNAAGYLDIDGKNKSDKQNVMPLALAGRVPVKVTLEGGPIRTGDVLTSSSKPGYAMRANEAGPSVGMALEAFDGSTGPEGRVLCMLHSGDGAAADKIRKLEDQNRDLLKRVDRLEKLLPQPK
ncbi:MAG: beta strand repeat-containing protein [Elusimicrobiota bacterium]